MDSSADSRSNLDVRGFFWGGGLGAYTDKFGCRMLQDICSCKRNYVTQDSRTDCKLIFWVTSTE